MNESERIKAGNTVSLIGICLNLTLAIMKLLIGIASGMISIIADAVNNLSDAGASTVSLIGFKLSSRPADDEHPFGHARYEYISGLVVSFLVMLAGVELFQDSVKKLISPEPADLSIVTFIILALSIMVKLGMSLLYGKVGSKIDSATILAAAQDSRNDCISTGAVLIASLIMYFSGIDLDAIMGILVALFVLYSGIGLVRDTIKPLLGTTPDEEVVKDIEKKIMSYEGVLGTHDLMLHDYGPGHFFGSVHVEVPAERNVLECHEIIDQIEMDFLQNDHINLVIHYDPIVTSDERVGTIRHYLKEEAAKIDSSLTIHDLRIVPGEDNTNVIFDCVVPHSCKVNEADIVKELSKKLAKEFPKHTAVIKVDHSFVSLNK